MFEVDKSGDYWLIISKEYDNLKSRINSWSLSSCKTTIDEDILHDTIIKCIDTLKYKSVDNIDFLKYVFTSYVTNLKREKEYLKNKANKINCDVADSEVHENFKSNIDTDYVIEEIGKRFGEKYKLILSDYINGFSIKELSEKYNEKSMYYIVNKIKEKIKELIL